MCHHCMGSLADAKLCSSMADYTNQTCMTDNATCATTEIKSNVSDIKAYVLGCVEVRTKISPKNCNLFVVETVSS